jgi:hypothetical protein
MKYGRSAILAIAVAAMAASGTPRAEAQEERTLGVILAVGDIMQCNSFKPRSVAVAELVAKELHGLAGTPVQLILLGDIAYPHGRTQDFQCFGDNWKKVVDAELEDANNQILPVPGNHEYQSDSAAPYFTFFAENAAVKAAREKASTEQVHRGNYGWYAKRFPDEADGWLLLGLNSHLPGSTARSDQYDWLKTELSSETGAEVRCVLAFWHMPVFSSGFHGHDNVAATKPPQIMGRMKHSYGRLYRAGASIVLAGHDHDYEQFLPHTDEGKPAADGLRSFVVGTGGNYIPDQDWGRWPDIVDGPMEKKVDGFLKITLHPGSYDWRFVPVSGTPISGERAGHGVCNERKPLHE